MRNASMRQDGEMRGKPKNTRNPYCEFRRTLMDRNRRDHKMKEYIDINDEIEESCQEKTKSQ
jgi:hypothetical protein